ncbi:hypothetical protein AAVH_30498 [Aphelenchoides avenae]|nr:hypothetical protein AAVH_30498 [Aphelenchus avenae]
MDVDNLYSFDKIFGKRLNNGMEEFAVKWSGYDWCDSTWEPTVNFAADAIQVFENKLQQHGVQYGLILTFGDVEEILGEAFVPVDDAPDVEDDAPEVEDLPMDIDAEEVANESYEWDADRESDSDYDPELDDFSGSD